MKRIDVLSLYDDWSKACRASLAEVIIFADKLKYRPQAEIDAKLGELRQKETAKLEALADDVLSKVAKAEAEYWLPRGADETADKAIIESATYHLTPEQLKSYAMMYFDNPTMLQVVNARREREGLTAIEPQSAERRLEIMRSCIQRLAFPRVKDVLASVTGEPREGTTERLNEELSAYRGKLAELIVKG